MRPGQELFGATVGADQHLPARAGWVDPRQLRQRVLGQGDVIGTSVRSPNANLADRDLA